MPIAVNVSALQFQQPQFIEGVAAALLHGRPAARLAGLELTESVLVGDADECLRRMRALASLGVALSIDDFGTGYSSLAYLKRFPIQRLKIDRSFVQGLPGDASDAGIVNAIVPGGPGAQSAGHRRGCRARSPAGLPGPRWLPRIPGLSVRGTADGGRV